MLRIMGYEINILLSKYQSLKPRYVLIKCNTFHALLRRLENHSLSLLRK